MDMFAFILPAAFHRGRCDTQQEIWRRNRERLALTLRDHRLWPWSFSWGYDSDCTCAMALAAEIGLIQPDDELTEVTMARVLGMSQKDALDVFFYFGRIGNPTPRNIARAIMKAEYLREGAAG